MPRKRKKKATGKLVYYPAVFTQDTYMACNAMITSGKNSSNRSKIVRLCLDLAKRSWDPDPLPFQARMSQQPFRYTRIMIVDDQKEWLDGIVAKGYTGHLAFNLALTEGLERLRYMREKLRERDRRRGKKEPPPSFNLPTGT